MSLSKTLAGRKRDSSIWDFYCFDENANKSTCLCSVSGETETAKTCGIKLTGKNSVCLCACALFVKFEKTEWDIIGVYKLKYVTCDWTELETEIGFIAEL
jgi:hypothetical protein